MKFYSPRYKRFRNNRIIRNSCASTHNSLFEYLRCAFSTHTNYHSGNIQITMLLLIFAFQDRRLLPQFRATCTLFMVNSLMLIFSLRLLSSNLFAFSFAPLRTLLRVAGCWIQKKVILLFCYCWCVTFPFRCRRRASAICCCIASVACEKMKSCECFIFDAIKQFDFSGMVDGFLKCKFSSAASLSKHTLFGFAFNCSKNPILDQRHDWSNL